MVDLALIQARVNHGLGIAAGVVGRPVTQFRPVDPLAPLSAAAKLGVIMAAFDSEANLSMTRPQVVGRNLFYLTADATNLRTGDYLSGADGVFFVASTEDLRPPVVLRTNATLSLVRPLTGARAGLNPPGADSASTEVTIFSGWPASVLVAGRAEAGDVALAGDLRMGGWLVLLPAIPGVLIRGSDVLVDQANLRRIIMSAELTAMGWRIETLQEAS